MSIQTRSVQTRSMTKGLIRPFVNDRYVFKDDRDFFREMDLLSDEDCCKIKILRFKRGIRLDDTLGYIIERLKCLEELHLVSYVNIGPCGIAFFKQNMPTLKVFALGENKY